MNIERYILGVVEQGAHEALGIYAAVLEVFVERSGVVVLLILECLLVMKVHVVHVMIAGIVGELQVWILFHQFEQRVFHRQNAAYYHRRLGVDMRIALEYIWKSLVHSACYLSVLLCSEWRKFAQSFAAFVHHLLYFRHYVFSEWCQLALVVGFHERVERTVIVFFLYQISRPVATVVRDIECFLTIWSRRERLLRFRICK